MRVYIIALEDYFYRPNIFTCRGWARIVLCYVLISDTSWLCGKELYKASIYDSPKKSNKASFVHRGRYFHLRLKVLILFFGDC